MFSKKKNNNEEYLSPTAQPLKLTTIAVGTILKGTVDVEGSLRIDGTIEGDITCHKTVVVGPQGKVTGKVTSASAILEGTLKGDIHISDKLILKSGCLMEETSTPANWKWNPPPASTATATPSKRPSNLPPPHPNLLQRRNKPVYRIIPSAGMPLPVEATTEPE